MQMCTDQKKCVQKMEIKHSISYFLQKVYSRTGKERADKAPRPVEREHLPGEQRLHHPAGEMGKREMQAERIQ